MVTFGEGACCSYSKPTGALDNLVYKSIKFNIEIVIVILIIKEVGPDEYHKVKRGQQDRDHYSC
jgi:hypothetical protein